VIRDVTLNGFAREVPEVHIWIRTEEAPETELIFDLRLSRVYFRVRRAWLSCSST
jgi:hypothetical protein